MKKNIKIALIAMIGVCLNSISQNQTVNGNLTISGNIDSGEQHNFLNKGVRHAIFNYSGNSNFYFGAGKDTNGNKKEMIFYNYNCSGGCNVPKINMLTDILYTPGRIGIGTETPTAKLDIASNSFGLPATSGSTPNGFLRIGYTSRTWGGTEILSGIINSSANDYAGYFQAKNPVNYSQNRTLLINPQGGNVGVGIDTPDKQLTVKNEIKILRSGNSRTAGDKAELIFGEQNNDYYSGIIRLENTNSNPGAVNPKMTFLLQDYNTYTPDKLKERMTILSNGNVGIGTTDTKGFKLGVNGKIAATEIKVANYSNWADFVFKKNYHLPTLKQVEKHIKEKGHLKDIPNAEEVAKNGFFLAEMDAKLLQKIEELTLYTIQQEKEIKELKKLVYKLLHKENNK